MSNPATDRLNAALDDVEYTSGGTFAEWEEVYGPDFIADCDRNAIDMNQYSGAAKIHVQQSCKNRK